MKELWTKLNLEDLVEGISNEKNEPEWLSSLRKKAVKYFFKNLEKDPILLDISKDIDFNDFKVYVKDPLKSRGINKETEELYNYLGINDVEKKILEGYSYQKNSTMLQHNIDKELRDKGVILKSMEEAFVENTKLVKKYMGNILDYKKYPRSALNLALMSGGVFIYVPKDVKIKLPVYSYFTIDTSGLGQFERGLIILDKNSEFYYVEGCAAPIYRKYSFHFGVLESYLKKGSHGKFITLQNWSRHIINAPLGATVLEEDSVVRWIDLNIGARKNIKKPLFILKGRNSKAIVDSISNTGKDQYHRGGAMIIHKADNTHSVSMSKSIVMDRGVNVYDNIIDVKSGNSTGISDCDSIMSGSGIIENFPEIKSNNKTSVVSHEAKTSYFDEDIKIYFETKGFSKNEALMFLGMNFFKDNLQDLPIDIAVEFKKLLEYEINKSVG